jgi:hypothetical protein
MSGTTGQTEATGLKIWNVELKETIARKKTISEIPYYK